LTAFANRFLARWLKTPIATALLPNAFGRAFLYRLPEGIVNAFSRILLHSGKYMAVKIERDPNAGVTESF
jgi:hypothetical protein